MAEGESVIADASWISAELIQEALGIVRPHGPEHVWRPARPVMLPG
jgi:hypothetical protein